MVASGDRVANVAERLAGMLDESARRLQRGLRQLSGDSTIVKFVARPDDRGRAKVQGILDHARTTAGPIAWLEIRSTNGAPLITVGNPPAVVPLPKRQQASLDTASRSVWSGPFVTIGDAVYSSVVAAIVGTSRDTLGYLLEFRRLSSAQSADALRGLIGADAAVLLGNKDGGVWTDLVKRVPGPPGPLRFASPREYVLRDGTLRLGAAANVPRTPWAVWVEIPRSVVLSPAREYLLEIAGFALIVIAAGTLGAWVLSRHITSPLLEVMRASQEISIGNYSRRAAVTSQDEVGLLATSFNRMADQVEESRRELEARVASRTSELKTTLARLEHAQEELVRRERLAILGQLAGGVGHELRNPLGVMTNALYYLGIVLRDASPDVREYLDILRTQIGLSEKIVGDLLDFARVKAPNREAVSLEQLVMEQLQRLGDVASVRVTMDFPPGTADAFADRVQIGQVVLNLVTNAVQAMNGKSPDGAAPRILTIRGRRADHHHVQLEVSDTGDGIAPENLDKIFEPLFTTKARGIGLGLAVSRTLARANDGDISVVSRLGEGATFFLTLPAAVAQERAEAA